MPSPLMPPRRYRAGDPVEDLCRACKVDRLHTVIVADPSGRPLRVQCDYCHSQHNFRGGPEPARRASPETAGARPDTPKLGDVAPRVTPQGRAVERPAFPLVAERERVAEPVMMDTPSGDRVDLEMLLRRLIREEIGLTPTVPAEKWRHGTVILKPGNAALQDKSWPIETLFHKIVMIRNRLRTLEQQVNAADLPEDLKLRLQGYVTACYGSLTSFNVLFADEADHFKGSSGE